MEPLSLRLDLWKGGASCAARSLCRKVLSQTSFVSGHGFSHAVEA
jgi:hypothetical protein